VTISATFYELILRGQIPEAQKDNQVISVYCTFGICVCKSCSNVGEIDPNLHTFTYNKDTEHSVTDLDL